jgi:hypothetical protein
MWVFASLSGKLMRVTPPRGTLITIGWRPVKRA